MADADVAGGVDGAVNLDDLARGRRQRRAPAGTAPLARSAQGAALVASRGSQGLAPGLERLSGAARARPLASGTSARMSMRLLTVADLPAHAEVPGRRAQGWQLACHSAHKHASRRRVGEQESRRWPAAARS